MGRNVEGERKPSGPGLECCMCGDHGLSSELFTCKNCRFRSQHKYCSNLYPRAASYHICNWCLRQKDEKTRQGNTKTSPNSPHKATIDNQDDDDDDIKMEKKKRALEDNQGDTTRTSSNQFKKQNKFPVAADCLPTPSSAGRKRVMTSDHGGIAKRINRRTRSEEISNGGIIIKQVFRNKVRRYKLLDEVSS